MCIELAVRLGLLCVCTFVFFLWGLPVHVFAHSFMGDGSFPYRFLKALSIKGIGTAITHVNHFSTQIVVCL